MKVSSITKGMNIKFATLPYSNADISTSMTAEVQKDDNPEEVGRNLTELLLQEMRDFKAAVDEATVDMFDKPSRL